MTRIKIATDATSDEQSQFTTVWGIMAEVPGFGEALGDLNRVLRDSGSLSPRLIELVRLRVAFHNQCRTCMAVRYLPDEVDEGLVCSLERPEEAPDLSDGDRAALKFADLFATNHLAINDDVYDGLRKFYSESELVQLGLWCATFVGFGRLAATWNMTETLPASFRDITDSPITPWGHDEVVKSDHPMVSTR